MTVIIGYFLVTRFSADLPDVQALRQVQYQMPLRIYSQDNLLIAQFGDKKRTPITIDQVPKPMIDAFLAAEDDRFYSHPGVDYRGLLRAALQLLLTGKKKQGGSTITMQVTRNFLLTPEKTYTRKIKEIILAFKIEREFSKDEILQLYLNKIYLGHHAYGIAAAAQVYYGKSLSELNLAEQAMIAGLPKAPSKYNPVTNAPRAKQRRDYILRRMLDLGYISRQDYQENVELPITAKLHRQKTEVAAPYVAEMVRTEIVREYGDQAYTSGLKVYTTIQGPLQKAADNALRTALHDYDRRHGYRGHLTPDNPEQALLHSRTVGDTQPALVEEVDDKGATARLKDAARITIPWENIQWAKQSGIRKRRGSTHQSTASIIKPGDLIRVRELENGTWALTQVPQVDGAIVALDPNNGAILALSGGFDFRRNKFNRVTQAKRQPGSGFKPIIYTTALEEGFTPASIINDAPIVIADPTQESEWRPENYSRKFFGPTRLRIGLIKSRNLISIRLLRKLGVSRVIATAERFGLKPEQLPRSLSLALGSGYANPLQMARIYAVFANGGFLVDPHLIDRVEAPDGDILYQAFPKIACPTCSENLDSGNEYAPRIISPQINFLMNSLLRDVVQRGTATKAKQLGRKDLAGKTGTTNQQRDAWFNGFVTATIAATAWVGYDDSRPLGSRETGGKAALPMWIYFMEKALQDVPEQPLTPPEGIIQAYIDPRSGLRAAPDSKSGIWEYFQKGLAPSDFSYRESVQTRQGGAAPVETLF